MPIYEYKCQKCGGQSEFLENSGKRTKKTCEHCGSSDLQKLFSIFAPKINPGDSKRCHGCTDYKCPHAGN